MPKFRVALIGLNNLFGRISSLLLKQSPLIKCVKLYDVANINAALDVSSVNTQCRVKAFLGGEQLDNALLDTDIIIIGDESQEISADDNYLNNLATKYSVYARAIANSSPDAVVVVATNPINSSLPLLSQLLAQQGCYNCDKVMGATAVDTVRANAILAGHLRLDPKDVVLPVIGGSSELTRVPIFSQSRPQFNLDQSTKDLLIERIKTGDKDIKKLKGTPETLNKSYATVKFLNSIMRGMLGEKNVTDITLSKTDLVPGVEYFSLPVVFGKGGIVHRFGIPKVTDLEQTLVKSAVANMKKDADRAALIIKGGDPELNECQFLSDEDKASKQKELFDLFVTTLNEVEEEFNIAFKPNQSADLRGVFKKRQTLKKATSKTRNNKKNKKNPLKALLPLKKDNKKKVTENKIGEGIHKKLQPRLNCNSIVLCEPLACPERLPISEQPLEQSDDIDEEVQDLVLEEDVQETKEKVVTNSLYTHNSDFMNLNPKQSKEEKKPVSSEEKRETVPNSEKVKVQRGKPSEILSMPAGEVKKSVKPKEAVLKLKLNDKLDKIGYYFEKLKQSSVKKLEGPVNPPELSSSVKVKNSGVVYHYNDNQMNSFENEAMAKPCNKINGVESYKGTDCRREIMGKSASSPTQRPRSRKRKKDVRDFKTEAQKHCGTMKKLTEIKNVSKSMPFMVKQGEKLSGTRAKQVGKSEEGKLEMKEEQNKEALEVNKEKCEESKKAANESKKDKQTTGNNEPFESVEEILHLKQQDPGLFRPIKRNELVLNPVNVSNYMRGKMRPEEKAKESVVTRRKYVLTADPIGKVKSTLNERLSLQTKSNQQEISVKSFVNAKDNELKSREKVVGIDLMKNDEGVTKGAQGEEELKESQEDSAVIQKLEVKDDVKSKDEGNKNASEVQGQHIPSAEPKLDVIKEISEQIGHKLNEMDVPNAVVNAEEGQFKEYDKKRLAVNRGNSIKLHTLKAFHETVSQPSGKTANLGPKDGTKFKKTSVFSYTNGNAETKPVKAKEALKPISRPSGTVEMKKLSALWTVRKKVNTLELGENEGNKDVHASICNRIRSQIKKNAEVFVVDSLPNNVGKKHTIPYYSVKLDPGKKKVPFPAENLRQTATSKPDNQASSPALETRRIKPLKYVDRSVSMVEKLPRFKGPIAPVKKVASLSRPVRKPARKIDSLCQNEKSNGVNGRRRRPLSCSVKTRTETKDPPKLKLSVKARPNGSVNSIHYDSLSTIDFARYWKTREKEENSRRYPCPIPINQTFNKSPHSETVVKTSLEKPSNENQNLDSTRYDDRPKTHGGTCADLIRAKQDKTLTLEDAYEKKSSAFWSPRFETYDANRLCLTPVDRRFDEYSTCHIPSLKQTEERYYLEERYD